MVYKIYPISTVILTSFSGLFALFNTLLQMPNDNTPRINCEQCSILLTLRKLLLQTLQNRKPHSNTAWRICISPCDKFCDKFYPWDRILYGD